MEGERRAIEKERKHDAEGGVKGKKREGRIRWARLPPGWYNVAEQKGNSVEN